VWHNAVDVVVVAAVTAAATVAATAAAAAHFAATDVNGCADDPCLGMPFSIEECKDMPAPGTGYQCECESGYAWDAFNEGCAACVSVVASVTEILNLWPFDVSVDAAEHVYISGEYAILESDSRWC
jgi:hypothetical protein